ncbi:hypothetical protein E0Z10_g7040 [Xylaria hypoxylon]|uniref:Uncharacterized protein n=1 Tax=Xylaria hypoxylon TaxID=37992 RepID=A0A4Z0YES9_9PEZI|nr:hypothetical protein E0Z10_g7040 [Xylaria hypoxylon]
MHLFRRRIGARNETPVDDTKNIDSSLPPSYEDSQDASLREVLQGARAVLPLLWPSSSSTMASSSKPEKNITLGTDPATGKSGRHGETINPSPSAQEDAIMEVLSNLAMAPCGGYPFLDRIRQFSDFYFTPYMASEGSGSSHEHNSSSPTGQETQVGIPRQEQQRIALQKINAPRESAALLLCARVLEVYYAGLGHVDSAADADIAQNPSTLYPKRPKEKNTSDWDAEKKRGGGEIPTSTSEIAMKTKLTQIAACGEEGCVCCDFDDAISNSSPGTQPKDLGLPARCSCGHPRTSHSSPPGGISRLLRRYTNWNSASYIALGHRTPTGLEKRGFAEIRVCGAPGTNCPCRDYDKGRHTARCGRCGHYDSVHFPINVAREVQKSEKRHKGKGKRGGLNTTGTDPARKKAEWELSWILVENAYRLLNQMA